MAARLPLLLPVLFLAAAALCFLAPDTAGGPSHGCLPQPFQPAAFLATAGSPAWPAGPGGDPGRDALPTSAMPHGDRVCSTDTTAPGPVATCSADLQSGVQKCSAHDDSGQQCSAMTSPGGTTAAVACSVLGTGRCSVLPPAVPSGVWAACSAIASLPAVVVECSILQPGQRLGCSGQNPSGLINFCSALSTPEADGAACSTLNSSGAWPNFCSVGLAENPATPQECSALYPNTVCSIRAGQKGACTALKGAALGPCSAFAAGSHCSTIAGGSGTRCRG